MPSSIPTTVSSDELQRIVASVSAPIVTDKEARRLELKAKSEDRTAKWPNTLEAMRKKKDCWKKDKEEREEEERKKIDVEEERLQRAARSKQIERANRILYEQTDRMKTLRSKQLLADCILHRELQKEEQNLLKTQEKFIQEKYDEIIIQKVFEGDQKEKEEKKKIQQKAQSLAMIQKKQLEEYKQRYIEELKEEKKQGELIKFKAEMDWKEEKEKEHKKKNQAKQAAEETQLVNLQLLTLKENLKEKEKVEDLKREEEAFKKEQRNLLREQLQKQKFEKQQARKQRMIDLATENLMKFDKKTEQRLQNQSKELRDKEEKEFKERADRRAVEKQQISQSRQQQIQAKQQQQNAQRQEEKEMIKQWEDFGKRIENQIKQEENDAKLTNIKIAIEQKQQADARRMTLMEEKAAELLQEQKSYALFEQEEATYRQVAAQAIVEAKQRGLENVYPIQKALVESRIDLLAASGFRV